MAATGDARWWPRWWFPPLPPVVPAVVAAVVAATADATVFMVLAATTVEPAVAAAPSPLAVAVALVGVAVAALIVVLTVDGDGCRGDATAHGDRHCSHQRCARRPCFAHITWVWAMPPSSSPSWLMSYMGDF